MYIRWRLALFYLKILVKSWKESEKRITEKPFKTSRKKIFISTIPIDFSKIVNHNNQKLNQMKHFRIEKFK